MSDLLSELRPETDDFESAWNAKWSTSPETDTSSDTAPAEPPAEDTASVEGQPRDEQGRFARVDTPAVDEHAREEELAHEEEQQLPEGEDEVASYLAKYGGDVRAALKAAADAQKVIGRQGGELGDLRQRLEQLETRTAQPAQPVVHRQITEADVQRLDEMAITNGPAALAQAQALDPSGALAARVIETWTTANPTQAMLFMADRMAEQKIAQLRAELQPALQSGQQSEADRQFVEAWTQLAVERPEIEQLAPAMKEIIDERGGLAKAILEGDVDTKVALLGTVADAAKARQTPVVQEAIAKFEAESREASRATKIGATVTPPKAQIGAPTGGTQTEKSVRDKEIERIKNGILGSEDTSILSGWTHE